MKTDCFVKIFQDTHCLAKLSHPKSPRIDDHITLHYITPHGNLSLGNPPFSLNNSTPSGQICMDTNTTRNKTGVVNWIFTAFGEGSHHEYVFWGEKISSTFLGGDESWNSQTWRCSSSIVDIHLLIESISTLQLKQTKILKHQFSSEANS